MDVAAFALAAGESMLVEICGLRANAFRVLRVSGAPPAQRIVEDAFELFDREGVQDLLSTGSAKRVAKGADWPTDHVHNARVLGVIF